MIEQLLLFEEPLEQKYDRKIKMLIEKYENLRKSQHARISKLQKELNDLQMEMEFLKSHICKNRIF